ncbi:MAG: flagellar basal body rod protein FlgB [Bradyrhizobiaceae bacterium]|nr:MAG: flagellar basal body rod protein FlgB [Bradyrhizobiaceae bacterium]
MAINDLPMLAMLRTKMQWHQERQRVLAENVSNSDTPGFKPRDLVEPKFGDLISAPSRQAFAMTRTDAGHIQTSGVSENFDSSSKNAYQIRPTGNAVSLEEEMMKAANNQMDYAAVTSLYSRSLGLIKTAIGKR